MRSLLPCLSWMTVALLAFAGDDRVDPALVGSWRSTIKNDQGEWTLTFTLAASGEYTTSFAGPAAIPEEKGTFQGTQGRWSVVKAGGQRDDGTYTFPDENTV